MLAKLSIGAKLTASIVASTVLAALVLTAVLVGMERTRGRAALVEASTSLAGMLATHSAAALLFDDAATARETLAALRAEGAIASAGLYDAEGELFAPFVRDDGAEVPARLPLSEGHRFDARVLELAREVREDGERLGTVWLRADTEALDAQHLRTLGVAAGLLALASLTALGVALALRRNLVRPLEALVARSERMAEGDLRAPGAAPRHDELGHLDAAFVRMGGSLAALVTEIRAHAAALAEASHELHDMGEHTAAESRRQKSVLDASGGSIASVVASIGEVATGVRTLSENATSTFQSMSAVDRSVEQVAGVIEGIAERLESVASSTSQLAASVSQVASGVSTLEEAAETTEGALVEQGRAIESVVENARSSRSLCQDTAVEAERGTAAVGETIGAIHEIETSFGALSEAIGRLSSGSQSIGEIVSVIEDVADETQLLSLNASIIAAQAGDQGRAFSVVAEQVKELASRTSESTREIRQLVSNLLDEIRSVVEASTRGASRVESGVARSRDAGERLGAILEGARSAASRVDAIVESAEHQARDLGLVRDAMGRVRAMVEQTRSGAREQTRATREIANLVEAVRGLGEEARDATAAQRSESAAVTAMAQETATMTGQILEATARQRRGSESVHESLSVLAQIADENIQRADALAGGVGALRERSAALEREVGRFRLAGGGDPQGGSA